MPKRSTCRGCGAEILWIETVNGKNMPCEVKQTTIVTPKGQVVYGHIPHWGNCPKAADFK